MVIPGESIALKFIPSKSELFLAIPEPFSEPFRVISKQSEKRFISRVTSWLLTFYYYIYFSSFLIGEET